MTQPAPPRLPSHIRPRPKAAISRTTSLKSNAADSLESSQELPPKPAAPPATPRDAPAETSTTATVALIRRVLCPAGDRRPLDVLLPPLTSSNDVDLQLYGLLAVIVKEFVYSWYAKLTPDRTFVAEVVNLIAHCTRDLEQRARRVDWEALLLDEIPELVQRHVFGTFRK